jgi:hypothetical protein
MDIAGIVALIVALASIGWQIWDYFPRLRMSAVDLYIPHVYRNMSLLFVRLAFVNPSSRVRSVGDIDIRININSTSIPVNFAEVEATYSSQDLHVLFHKLTKDNSSYQFPIPTSELLQITLDIPPHQSASKWYVFGLMTRADYVESQSALVMFRVYDHRLKASLHDAFLYKRSMASCSRTIPLGKIVTTSWSFSTES